MMHFKSSATAVLAVSSLIVSLPAVSVAQSENPTSSRNERAPAHEERHGANVEVVSEVTVREGTFQVLSVTKGDASWFEITSLREKTSKPKIVFQDTVLFTNSTNDGGAAVPREAKQKLAYDFAKRAIKDEGGVVKFSESLKSYATYGVPLPTGLYREALIEHGVRFPAE